MVVNLLEGLAVEEGLGDLRALGARHLLGHLQVRLVDLGEARVDDLLVELVLLLEAEHLRRLLGEGPHQPIEHEIV